MLRLMSNHFIGVCLVVISALCFSLQPLFASALYELGWSPLTVLVLRFGFAVLIMGTLLSMLRRNLKSGFELKALLFGFCMAGSALGYYTAGQRLGFSLAVVLLFAFPVGVTVFLALRAKAWPSAIRLLALGISVIGTYWVIGGIQGEFDWVGVVVGLGAAVCYGSAMVISDGRVVRDPWVDVFWVSVGAVCILGAFALYQGSIVEMSVQAVLLGAGLAVTATILATGLLIAGIARVGGSDAATISLSEALFSATLAVWLLGDSVTAGLVVGGALILLGAGLLSRSPARSV